MFVLAFTVNNPMMRTLAFATLFLLTLLFPKDTSLLAQDKSLPLILIAQVFYHLQ